MSEGISDFLLCKLEYNVSVTVSTAAAKQAKIRYKHALMADGDYALRNPTLAHIVV